MLIEQKRPRETAREYALRIIRENIINLELEPGSKISENELAAEMHISRTPVREALIELNKASIVEIYPQKGSYISLIDRKQVDDAHFMRVALETSVVELACEIITEQQLEELAANVHMEQFYADNHNNAKLLLLDDQFHYMIYEAVDKVQTYELLKNVMICFDRIRRLQMKFLNRQYIIDDHKAILQAIKDRDSEKAQRMMKIHLSHHNLDWEELIEKFPNYFQSEEKE